MPDMRATQTGGSPLNRVSPWDEASFPHILCTNPNQSHFGVSIDLYTEFTPSHFGLGIYISLGTVAEWLIAAVLKTAEP
jgi:hypothetical protein